MMKKKIYIIDRLKIDFYFFYVVVNVNNFVNDDAVEDDQHRSLIHRHSMQQSLHMIIDLVVVEIVQ